MGNTIFRAKLLLHWSFFPGLSVFRAEKYALSWLHYVNALDLKCHSGKNKGKTIVLNRLSLEVLRKSRSDQGNWIQFSVICGMRVRGQTQLSYRKINVFFTPAFIIVRVVSAIFLLLQWKIRQGHQLRMGRERVHAIQRQKGDLKQPFQSSKLTKDTY